MDMWACDRIESTLLDDMWNASICEQFMLENNIKEYAKHVIAWQWLGK